MTFEYVQLSDWQLGVLFRQPPLCLFSHIRGPPRGFGEQGNKGIYFRGTGEQRPNFEGNRETKTILGNREH